jgi:sugar lactone lactonase YvrE
MAVSRDGALVATSAGDRTIRLWDPATGEEVRRLKLVGGYVNQAALSPDGKMVASGDGLWDVRSGKRLARLKSVTGMEVMVFAPDGRTLALANPWPAPRATNKRPTVRLWDVAQAKEIKSFEEQPVHALTYAPDGKTLAAGNGDGTIALWDVGTGRERRRIPGHRREVNSVAFSPDGKVVASSSFDGDLFLWDAASGQRLRQLSRDKDPRSGRVNVLAVTFAHNGKMLASAEQPFTSRDGASITLWELATGQVRLRLIGHQGDVNGLAFAGDSRTLVSNSTDTTALVWDLTAALRPPLAKTGDLSAKEVQALWADLLAPDAARGYRAVCTLARSPASVSFLGRRLTPPPVDGERIARLIKALDSPRFRDRNRAAQELEAAGEAAEPALRKALEGQPSVEVHRRLSRLLEKLAADGLRVQRAVEALELMSTAEARQLLRKLAQGTPEARLTQEAKAALARLVRRRAAKR